MHFAIRKHCEVKTFRSLFFFFFCSFGMAYEFIDCIGDDVDVVSDSEVCGGLTKAPISYFNSEACS